MIKPIKIFFRGYKAYSLSFPIVTLMIVLTFILGGYSTQAYAQEISPQEIEQFKKLPKSQQQALAQTMGVDFATLEKQLKASGKTGGQSAKTETFPRGTQFDAEGNPTSEEESEELEDSEELKPFGYDVFANSPQTFAPMMDIAIPADYIIGPGDKISIQVFGKEKDELELTVNREGQIIFPSHGPFTVSGLSFNEMKRLLTARIKEKVIGVDVVVGIASLRSMRVFVLGDAHKPGPYTLSSLSSITHAIFAAGGISDIGSLRNIQLKRAGKLVTTLDLYDLLIKGDSRSDVLLQSGDVIFIAPKGNAISVEGEVRRPAIYELSQNESFNDVLAMSGGLLPTAFAKTTRVERYNQDSLRTVVDIDLTNINDLAKKAQAGDAVYVMKAAEMFEQSITVIGAVTRPGKYQWQAGQRITDIFPNIDSHLLQSADLNYSIVVREIDIARNIEILQFDLAKAISAPKSKDNIVLQGNDKILVFANIIKLIDSKISLDSLAFTQDNLAKKEQQLAKEKYKKKQFWLKYGDSEQIDQLDSEEAAAAKLVEQSIAQFSGGELEEELDLKELTLFSRQRLLMPIIEKLKRQGKSGQPIQLVEADGEVKFPGIYPLAKNARISDLIAAAGGLTESAYVVRAEVSRNQIINHRAQQTSIMFSLSAALAGDEKDNVLLSSKDRLNIHQIPAWSENNVVELRGEFVFPGKYTVRRGESLADLITKAGGFTKFAHQDGSVFTRVQLREIEQQNLLKLTADLRIEMASKSMTDQNYSQSYAEVQQMLADMANVQPVGRLVIDLPRVVDNKNYDVLLEGGDVLYVPTMKNSINVVGQVQVTSSHVYDVNLSADDYLAQSGGSKKRADEDRIYIISANGSIKMMESGNWFSSDAGDSLKSGDTIVVPLDAEYMNNLALWTSVTGIIYNSAVAIAAISGI
ncbi:polysaccharide biosynthesis/export protein [Colwellia demingiae]|uniref:Polysaccharide biosynthesis/export protein n=1 Tax=Colwellia demingiae TaxID=89401 RepID=A0A5C6QEN4_9GAMM|nr:SLBB domain-containing protein [Colwellia demingiae]TWX67211.1 polysaccharide biosynthesis/export protein [Colwellia demingiae]